MANGVKAKSQSFTIYLLKEGYDTKNALSEDHPLTGNIDANGLPKDAKLFVLDGQPRKPWWRDYFEIKQELTQVNKGALVFLPVDGRWFVLSFGYVSHHLIDASYEYDFGMMVTLNCLDPEKLKSADTLDPGVSKRRRTQLPNASELPQFDFDRDTTILSSLTGKVRDEYKGLFANATGSSLLRISTKKSSSELVGLCKELLALYESEEYKDLFPEIHNILPVKDPVVEEALNNKLIEAFTKDRSSISLMPPEIIDYSDIQSVTFLGKGRGSDYDDVDFCYYDAYLKEKKFAPSSITLETLKKSHKLELIDEEGKSKKTFSIFSCLVFETTLEGDQKGTFHLTAGKWYRIDNDFIEKLKDDLDPHFVNCDLPPYNHQNEGKYNKEAADGKPDIFCLDRESISPDGQTQVEPCDLLKISNDLATFYHVKVGTFSKELSHLFNQGLVAIQLIRSKEVAGEVAVEKLEALIRERNGDHKDLIKSNKYKIVFGIVTPKAPDAMSQNLPLFSRISLRHCMKALQLMNVKGEVMFIKNERALKKEGATGK